MACFKQASSVAIDGNCTRKNAERMFVRVKRAFFKVNLGGTAIFVYRPETQIFSALRGIFLSKIKRPSAR